MQFHGRSLGASVAGLALLASSCLPLARASGSVVLAGGALDDKNAEVWQRIVDLGGGSNANFGVLTAGSIPESQDPKAGTADCDNSKCNGDFYGDILKRYGARSATWISVDLDHASAAQSQEIAANVSRMTGFWIGGGDQSRYTDLLFNKNGAGDTPVLAAMRAAIQKGAVVAGTSAGSTIQQKGPMITGGESYYGIRDGSSATAPSDDPNKVTYRAEGGFGFFDAGLADTHFGARGRHGRLIRLAMDTKQPLAFGVDEDTALVSSNGALTVLGNNSVHVISLKDAQVITSGGWGVRTVRWSLLRSGDAFDLKSGKVLPGKNKSPYRGEARSVSFRTTDVLSSPDNTANGERAHPYELVRLAEDLVHSNKSDSTSGESYEEDPVYTVTLSPGKSYTAWRSSSRTITFQDIVLDIQSK